MTSLTASTSGSLTFAYNAAGRLSTVTDSTGRTTTYIYDSTNQFLLSVTDGSGDSHHFTYQTTGSPATLGALLSVEHPSGAIDNFIYDAQGRLAETNRNGNDDTETYAYGPGGDVSVTNADGGTSHFSYNERGLLAKYEDALGSTTHSIYDSSENLTESIDDAGQATFYQYDSDGNLTRTTGPGGAVVAYSYAGPVDRMASYTDPDGNVTNYGRDSQGNLLSINYPDGSQDQFTYNPIGELSESIDRAGQAIHDTYNSMGELTEEDFADGTKQVYTYDKYGDRTSATGSQGTIGFQYDPASQDLLEVTYPGGDFLKFTYDDADRRTKSVDQTGFTVNYSYTASGLLAGLTDGHGNPIASYTYDTADRLIEKDLGNGNYTTYTYDLAGHVLQIVNHAPDRARTNPEPATPNSITHTTAWAARRVRRPPTACGPINTTRPVRLVHAVFTSNNPSAIPNQDLEYVYDQAGNRVETILNGVTTPYVTNDLNEYTEIGSAALSYDANGNLISQTGATGTTTYTYNDLNRLTGVTVASGSTSYQYDAIGNLSTTTVNGQTTQYVVDPTDLGNIVGEYTGSGNLIDDFTYGLGLTSLVNSSGQASYYDTDASGSVAGLSNENGSYQNAYQYLPFGGVMSSSETIANPFQFVGLYGVMADANGLDLMRARFDATSEGDFISPDPLGLAGGQANIYVYADQNPLSLLDPSGLCFGPQGGLPLGFLAGAAFGGVISPALAHAAAGGAFNSGFIAPLFPCATAGTRPFAGAFAVPKSQSESQSQANADTTGPRPGRRGRDQSSEVGRPQLRHRPRRLRKCELHRAGSVAPLPG